MVTDKINNLKKLIETHGKEFDITVEDFEKIYTLKDQDYHIFITYETGSSFGSHIEKEDLGFKWKNRLVVEENVKRIKENARLFSELESYFGDMTQDEALEEILKKPWAVKKGDSDIEYYDCFERRTFKGKKVCFSMNSIRLLKDDGSTFITFCMWNGYFETLISADIIIK